MSISLMSAIFESTTLGPTERLIMLALADHANSEGACYPSIGRLCQRTGLSERAVQTNIRKLVEAGYIRIAPGGGKGRPNLYFISANPAVSGRDTAATNSTKPRSGCTPQEMHPAADAPQTPQQMRSNPAADAPEPSGTVIGTVIGGGDAREALPDGLRERALAACNVDPVSGLTGRGGQMIGRADEVAALRRLMADRNITEDEAIHVIADAMAAKSASRDPGPPSSLRFFIAPLERYADARDAPAPRAPDEPIPPDWVPSRQNIADAAQRNLTASEIDHEAQQFRDYHLARDSRFRDWDAAWRSWVGNAARRQGPGPRNAGSGAGHSALLAAFQRAAGSKPE